MKRRIQIIIISVMMLCLIGCVSVGNQYGWNDKKIATAEDFGKDNKAKFGVVEKGVNTIKDGAERLEEIGN